MEDKFETLFRLLNEKAPDKHPVFHAVKIAEETGEAARAPIHKIGSHQIIHLNFPCP